MWCTCTFQLHVYRDLVNHLLGQLFIVALEKAASAQTDGLRAMPAQKTLPLCNTFWAKKVLFECIHFICPSTGCWSACHACTAVIALSRRIPGIKSCSGANRRMKPAQADGLLAMPAQKSLLCWKTLPAPSSVSLGLAKRDALAQTGGLPATPASEQQPGSQVMFSRKNMRHANNLWCGIRLTTHWWPVGVLRAACRGSGVQ